MNCVLVFSALFAVALSAPQQGFVQQQQQQPIIPILSRTETRDDAGQFSLQYQTANGITFTEQGALKKTAEGNDYVLVKQGSYRYTSPEGVPVYITYTADENGFHPQGDQIPVVQQ